ncbi:hypothetical protein [Arthrobacter sp. L77]|uniref:hypothetical protein n=1 Tax=Arthrobacter sp. L77 TaxID=1496689 RepID=UPI0012E06BB6|nr:hypothetical protein [Arthrobacter sp. L77]
MSTNYSPAEYEYEWTQEEEGEADYGSNEFESEKEENLESELAMEFLSLSSEEELDQFLGKLARSVVKGASKFIKSPIGKMVGGALKTVAKTALPIVGGAVGSFVAPGIGTAIGSKLGSMAGGLLEVEEAEAMDETEAEEEAARRYVRFARASYRNAARTPVSVPPLAAARAATISAARTHAPSLLRPGRGYAQRRPRRGPRSYGDPYAGAVWGAPQDDGDSEPSGADEGRWIRRNGRVIILGL